MKRLLCVVLLAACHRAPRNVVPIAAPPSLPLRLVDHAAEAHVDGDLRAAFAAQDDPLVSPSPLAPSSAWPRALQVSFAEADLNRLLTGGPSAAPSKKLDLTWNRTRGVYEAREALFLPDGVTYAFTLPAGPAAVLRGELGSRSSAATVVVEMSDRALSATPIEAAGRWQPVEVALPPRRETTTLAIRAEGGTAFFGEPIVRTATPPAKAGPNVLFILVDTLRQDALPAMPRLVARATQGARFDEAITAATWTRPSLIAALGGDLPTRLGHSAEDMIPSDRERRRFRALRPALLPRRLEEAGYVTRAIGNNFFLLGFPRIGLDLGIDAVTDVRDLVLDTPAITAEAIRFLEAPHEAPFFLYLHYDGPHWPYTPPPGPRAETKKLTLTGLEATRDPMINGYLGEAAYVDRALGDLFGALDRTVGKDTIVVLIGDHGEVFDPAHAYTVDALQQPTLHHHGWSAYDEILRVPLVIWWQGHIAPRVVTSQTSLVDLAPTLAELAGLSIAATPALPAQGRSLAPALLDGNGAWPTPRAAFAEGQDVRALRSDGWLYLQRSDGRLTAGKAHLQMPEELYEVGPDPLQHRNRVGDAPHVLARMRAEFASIAPSLPAFPEPVVHLAVAEDARAHRVHGTIRCDACTIAVRDIEHGLATPTKDGVTLDLDGGARVELVLDPPNAPLTVRLARDRIVIDADHLLVGALALPLLGGGGKQPSTDGAIAIPSDRLEWLDSAHAPFLGETGDVVIWRDPAGPAESTTQHAAADGEVATMMQRWGYAQSPGTSRAP